MAGILAPVAILNLGGVGNLTWVDPGLADPAAPGALLAFDTGPANAPVNDLMRARRASRRMSAGNWPRRGRWPKASSKASLPIPNSRACRQNRWTAMLVWSRRCGGGPRRCRCRRHPDGLRRRRRDGRSGPIAPTPPARLLVTGGGRHNATLMGDDRSPVDCPTAPVEEMGWNGDMLEAQAFAYLAVRVARKALPHQRARHDRRPRGGRRGHGQRARLTRPITHSSFLHKYPHVGWGV